MDGVYISFSGGKDSTVLLHLVREIYPQIDAVYVDTGLEYPEIRAFVKIFENVSILHPKKNFRQVIAEYGYPMISKEISGKTAQVKRSIELGNYDTVDLWGLRKRIMTCFCGIFDYIFDCPVKGNCQYCNVNISLDQEQVDQNAIADIFKDN